jgi:hypothetical protein
MDSLKIKHICVKSSYRDKRKSYKNVPDEQQKDSNFMAGKEFQIFPAGNLSEL